MTDNPLRALEALGQAVWLDFVERGFLARGGLARLIAEDGVTGVTSNPSIFEKAMGQGNAYDADFRQVFAHGGTVEAAFESGAIADIKAAAAALRPIYDRLAGRDGYVSLEVAASFARDATGTVVEAQRLWAAVGEPNLMVKVPGTPEGAAAVRTLITEGINVNVTLLFAREAYQAVAEAYCAGLEARLAQGLPIDRIASVASFFVSRIDTAIDQKIDARLGRNDAESSALAALRGKVAIANAKLAYAWFQELTASARWRKLAAAGATPQRLLWASTGTKDKAYPDTLYVAELIGPETVNTMPPATMDAFRDHGVAAPTLTQGVAEARHVLAEADRLGLDLGGVTSRLVDEGIKQFADAGEALLAAVARQRLGADQG